MLTLPFWCVGRRENELCSQSSSDQFERPGVVYFPVVDVQNRANPAVQDGLAEAVLQVREILPEVKFSVNYVPAVVIQYRVNVTQPGFAGVLGVRESDTLGPVCLPRRIALGVLIARVSPAFLFDVFLGGLALTQMVSQGCLANLWLGLARGQRCGLQQLDDGRGRSRGFLAAELHSPINQRCLDLPGLPLVVPSHRP